MYEYKVTFARGAAADTFIVDSPIDPASLVLEGDYSMGEHEYVQERLAELEDLVRSRYDFSPRQEFMRVTCPDGTIIEPT
jgi:hypothetical protein